MSLAGVLQLVRPPNVFTAIADSFAGLVVVSALGVAIPDRACAIVLVSACLYLAGIVLNDVFDRRIDAVERPMRPIPSGAVTVRFAAALGFGLLAAGLAIAAWIGRGPFIVATVLAACVLLYDGGAKRTKLGPLVMGSCRGLDLALGITAGLGIAGRWPAIAIAGPIVLALYVAALTYVARDEVDGNTARRARTGLAAMAVVAGAALVGLVVSWRWPATGWAWPWIAATLALGWRNWSPLWHRQDGPSTGRAIGGGIMLIPLIDATVCAVAGAPFRALVVALLVMPALYLKQFFSPT